MSLGWTIEISDTARKQLKKMNKQDAGRILSYLIIPGCKGRQSPENGESTQGKFFRVVALQSRQLSDTV